MLRVGLTGGIGCGKSTVAAGFAALEVPLIDTDAIAHQLTGVDGSAMPAIHAAFDDAVVQTDGALDRLEMRRRVFSNPAARTKLETILHPLILQHVQRQLQSMPAVPYVLIVVPLLLETPGYRSIVDRVLVVDCLETQQIARASTRDGLSNADIQAVMAAQLDRDARLAGADDIVHNTGDPTYLQQQILPLHHKYLELSSKQP